MFWKFALGGLGLVAVIVAAMIGVLSLRGGTGEEAAAAPGSAPTPMIQYAAKFVCGQQATLALGPEAEPPVKPGNYATEINIHNPHYLVGTATANLRIAKKLVVLVGTRLVNGQEEPFTTREPAVAKPTRLVTIQLPPDAATMDDCQAIWGMANTLNLNLVPGELTIGYLIVFAPREIDVDAVYTVAVPGSLHDKSSGISIDVERIAPKRVLVPENVIKPQ